MTEQMQNNSLKEMKYFGLDSLGNNVSKHAAESLTFVINLSVLNCKWAAAKRELKE
jgi:hypothetical protein